VPGLRLELKANGEYVQTTYDPTVQMVNTPAGFVSRNVLKTFKGTYSVGMFPVYKGPDKLKQVILRGMPYGANNYFFNRYGLNNVVGLWAKKPPPAGVIK
jgi:hypothetical protein